VKLYSIGVFQSSEDDFFQKLVDQQIDTFCDIRLRRGVRGRKYAFVNSTRLQEKLVTLNIRYLHVRELTPTAAIRAIQQSADQRHAVSNTNRESLDPQFISAYSQNILDSFDVTAFLLQLKSLGAKRIVFFCVEEKAKACHRSLVVERLGQITNSVITHV
jgi:uncharacterized protein (DUF488 family)